MKTRPILFSGSLVRAILADRKHVTRRPLNPQPEWGGATWGFAGASASTTCWTNHEFPPKGSKPCPFGVPKDRLWVRETCCIEHKVEGVDHNPPHDDGRPVQWLGDDESGRWWQQPHYRATDPAPELVVVKADGEETSGCRWRPSIHMPRWASRITLEITAVGCERLWDITEEQARAEGLTDIALGDYARDEFETLWDTINGKRHGLSWADNPWCWAVSFRRLEPTP